MKGFYHIWALRPSWSCDPDAANKLSFPPPKEAPHKIWIRSAKRFLRRRCLSIVDCYEMDKTSISMFEILEPGGSALGKYSI